MYVWNSLAVLVVVSESAEKSKHSSWSNIKHQPTTSAAILVTDHTRQQFFLGNPLVQGMVTTQIHLMLRKHLKASVSLKGI